MIVESVYNIGPGASGICSVDKCHGMSWKTGKGTGEGLVWREILQSIIKVL